VALDARVVTPSGKRISVPGFYHRTYTRALQNRNEQLTPSGEPSWRVRWTPSEVGRHEVQFVLRDRSGVSESSPITFNVAATNAPGFIRISNRDHRYFAFDNGAPYFPIGANTCWAYSRGTFDYDDWFPRYAEAGCNYGRLWLSPNWTTFALERSGKSEEGRGLGQFDLANAWRIDYVLELAASRGMSLMLCIDSYNILRQKDGYPQWDNTPHNIANGGPLNHPTEFWTNSVMNKLYRDKLRYLVARYSYSTALLSWEFWNEVDITTGYRSEPSRDWHARMAETLRRLDPHSHLITTSFAGTPGDPRVDRLPGLDYVQTHHYNNPDLATTLASAQVQKSNYGKPHIVGEIGADSGGPRNKDDLDGLQIHDPIWVSIATGGSGTAQPWWWDNYIHPRNLYHLFAAATRFTRGIDWPQENFREIAPRIEWQSPPNPPIRSDLVIENGPASWNASPFNQPRRIQISTNGASGQLPVASIQHGIRNHVGEHNPITFETDLPTNTQFAVEVTDVSGHGGAALKITLDGKTVLTREFADTVGQTNTATLKKYAGSFAVEIPAGKHTVVVENPGPDWFMASYRFKNVVTISTPPVLAWAIGGRETAIVWARVKDRTWRNICERKQTIAPAPPTIITLAGLNAGIWDAELWDTWKGEVTQRMPFNVGAGGEARVLIPELEKDIAIKLRKRR